LTHASTHCWESSRHGQELKTWSGELKTEFGKLKTALSPIDVRLRILGALERQLERQLERAAQTKTGSPEAAKALSKIEALRDLRDELLARP
jgi:hypothetical protein